jgi:hypothetical protein
VEQFVLAFDSNLAPIVGQQITITSANAAAAGPRIDLLVARAAAGECDLVAKGTFAGEQRGAYRLPSGMFRSDQTSDPLTTEATVRTTAGTAGQEVTYTCVPPGSGERIGVDRDGDGFYDHDELDAGSDPADPASVPGGTTTTTSPTTTTTSTTIPAGNGQAIKGSSFVVRAPASGNPAARKFSLAAKEVTSPNGVVGDPIANGATLTVDISGTKPSSETFVLAPGSGWRAVSGGFRYRSTGTVRKLLIKVTAAGLFSIKASGKGQAVLVPPNTGSSVEATPRHRRRRSLLHVVRRSGRWRLRPGHRESLAREESAGRRRVPVIGPPWSVH